MLPPPWTRDRTAPRAKQNFHELVIGTVLNREAKGSTFRLSMRFARNVKQPFPFHQRLWPRYLTVDSVQKVGGSPQTASQDAIGVSITRAGVPEDSE